MINLDDFVAQGLLGIVRGIESANAQMGPGSGRAAPLMITTLEGGRSEGGITGWAEGEGKTPVVLVTFDVAVTAVEGSETRGGIGVLAGVVTLGSPGKSEQQAESSSRMRFNVPLLLPRPRVSTA